MKRVNVNVSTVVNASTIRREKRNGRDVVIVPSATLPDNIIMNGSGGPILYPADEIEKAYKGLERTPAPLGHPAVNGMFVSARDPEGLNLGWIGAWNENVRRENGRVLLDKVIDVEIANQSEGGKSVLAAVDKQAPIHTSTGILMTLEVANAADHKFVARNMVFDHDAILLDRPGAAGPDQGVGIFVNAEGEQVDTISQSLDEDVDRELTWAAESIVRAFERKEQQPLIERIKIAMLRLVQGDPTPDQIEGVALNEDGDTMDKAQFDAMMAKLDGMSGGLTKAEVEEIVANQIKPVADTLAEQARVANEKADADRQSLIEQVVNAKLLPEDEAKTASVPVLNALLATAPRQAFRVNSGYRPAATTTDRGSLAPKGE